METNKFIENSVDYPKKTLEAIAQEIKEIDLKKVSKEVLEWLIANVEEYIDNHEYIFRVDFVLENTEGMTELKRLQDIFRSIPETDKEFEKLYGKCNRTSMLKMSKKCREDTYGLLDDILTNMKNNIGLRNKLFERMVFYYELKGFTKTQELLTQKMNGSVDIKQFDYDALSMGVKTSCIDPITKISKTVKEFTLPEGFTLLLEIAISKDELPMSMF